VNSKSIAADYLYWRRARSGEEKDEVRSRWPTKGEREGRRLELSSRKGSVHTDDPALKELIWVGSSVGNVPRRGKRRCWSGLLFVEKLKRIKEGGGSTELTRNVPRSSLPQDAKQREQRTRGEYTSSSAKEQLV